MQYVYGTFTLCGAPFQDDFHFLHLDYRRSSPHISPRFPMEIRFVLFRFRSPLITESRLISFPLPTEMLQFRRFPFLNEEWHRVPGGPIQQFADPRDSCLSPQLIAACHDLLRLSSRAIPQSGCSIFISTYPLFFVRTEHMFSRLLWCPGISILSGLSEHSVSPQGGTFSTTSPCMCPYKGAPKAGVRPTFAI